MPLSIALIRGDGIGPEISDATVEILNALDERFKLGLSITPVEAGDACLKKTGKALPQETVETIKRSDVCLKAPVGQTAADTIVKLRQMLELYANVRPTITFPNVDSVKSGIDLVIARENTEDLYSGYEFEVPGGAVGLRVITREASLKIAEYAFKLAKLRGNKKKVVAVHKMNVLKKTGGVFVEASRQVAERNKEISFSEMLIDTAAMNLIREPEIFDVILTTNVFGDILSDEAAQLAGGLGLAPSGNIGDDFGLFEPVHGSAPDIAGQGIANPISMVLSAKMMFEWLQGKRGGGTLAEAAAAINQAVKSIMASRKTTSDIGGKLSTQEVGQEIVRHILSES